MAFRETAAILLFNVVQSDVGAVLVPWLFGVQNMTVLFFKAKLLVTSRIRCSKVDFSVVPLGTWPIFC